jgi:hypothetical protein
MWVQILIGLMVLLASILAPVVADQERYGPDQDVFNALPRVMAPGPGGASDGPSLADSPIAACCERGLLVQAGVSLVDVQ